MNYPHETSAPGNMSAQQDSIAQLITMWEEAGPPVPEPKLRLACEEQLSQMKDMWRQERELRDCG